MILTQQSIHSIFAMTFLLLIVVLPASAQVNKPAYMISSGNVVAPEKMGAYLEASKPLFKAAGSEEIAFGQLSDSNIQLLEGEWPYEGLVMIIKFPSMDVLMNFWNSPEYQEAMKLRDGVVAPNFTIAIEKSR